MSTVEEIKTAIEQLSLDERAKLEKWLHGWQDDNWDRQIQRDAVDGKLNRLIDEAEADAREGRLRDVP